MFSLRSIVLNDMCTSSVLLPAVHQAREQGRKHLDPTEIADWKAQYHTLLQEGYQANPPPGISDTSPHPRRKQSPARHLLDRLSNGDLSSYEERKE